MFSRKSAVYAGVVTAVLLSLVFGTYSVKAQTGTTPTATPAEEAGQAAPSFDPSQMAGTMTSMLDQMEAMMAAAPDAAAHQRMAPAMMNTLNGMMGLNQAMMDQMKSMPAADRQAVAGPMMESMTRMTGMMGKMQPMMGNSSPMTGTMPMSGTQSMKPIGGDMQMGQMMGMMGQMMQMMGGGMMGGGMMAQGGAGMMGDTAPISGTMPMSGTQSMKPMGGGMEMQMGQMMGMMGQMMQMMGQMHGGMMDHAGSGMMGGQGMGQMDSSSPMSSTTTTQVSPSTEAKTPQTDTQPSQSIEGGGVTVKVTPFTLTDETATTLDFEVVLDTHSGELNYDLAELALLRDNLGNKYQPAAWTPGENTGHHVSGKLSFADRDTILQSDVTELTLDVTDIAGVSSRIFSWSVGE
jgi:hypothetical protein